MSAAQDLARRIAVRHKAADHLRFGLPAELCGPARAAALEAGLRGLPGVHRVVVDGRTCKLAVHFDPQLCGIHDVARRLRSLLDELPVEEAPSAAALPAPDSTPNDPFAAARTAIEDGARRLLAQARATVDELRRPDAPAGSFRARIQPVLASALTEKAMVNFLNDLVAFYLIKVHWELITRRWIKEPLKYGNAWLTIFYLVFLLVRYRKQNLNK